MPVKKVERDLATTLEIAGDKGDWLALYESSIELTLP